MEITFKAFAYIDKWTHLDEVKAGKAPIIWTWDSMKEYTQIGTAVVTVTLHSEQVVHQKQLAELKEKLQEVRAQNEMRENAILLQISRLQALTLQAA